MKRIALLMFALVAMCANAQEIIYDKTEGGIRTIICSDEIVTTGKTPVFLGLSFSRSRNLDSYRLNFTIMRNRLIHVKQKAKISFVQSDGTNIVLYNIFDEVSQKTGSYHKANLISEISSTQLNLLMLDAKRIKIETTTGTIDEPINESKLSKLLLLEFDLIQNKL